LSLVTQAWDLSKNIKMLKGFRRVAKKKRIGGTIHSCKRNLLCWSNVCFLFLFVKTQNWTNLRNSKLYFWYHSSNTLLYVWHICSRFLFSSSPPPHPISLRLYDTYPIVIYWIYVFPCQTYVREITPEINIHSLYKRL